MWAICVVAWCIFLLCVCTAITLEQKVIEEAEKDLPFNKRLSWTTLNGRRVAGESFKRHKLLFPHSRLRMLSRAAWIAAAGSGIIAFTLISRTFHI